MKRSLLTLLGAMALLPGIAQNNVAPWGWATCSDEEGTAYTLNGGCFSDSKTVTLKAKGNNETDDAQIKQAIVGNDVIIFDGSAGDFVIGSVIKIGAAKNKTLIGINNARLTTQFYLTAEDKTYLKQQNLDGLSSTDQYTGTLPDGTTVTCDKRAFFTKKAMMELQYQKTGAYTLPNKAGIFDIEGTSENIIIRNLSLIGPGSVDIDGSDLITNEGQHVWVDHCTLVDSQDGALDSKRCDWATYTFNHFYYTDRSYSHAYTCGCGWVSNHEMVLHLTFADNIWGEGCVRRLPQVDDAYIHLVNNYHNCPGNSVGMTINGYSRALVECNYAAAGVSSPLTGSGSSRNVTALDNSFTAYSVGTAVTVPYQYTKIAAADVPALLTGTQGAGATLGNDAEAILATIPVVERGGEEAVTTYVLQKDDGHISVGGTITEVGGITATFDASVTDWKSGGTSSSAMTVDGVDLTGFYAMSNSTNGAPVIFATTKPGTLSIFVGGDILTSKSVNMTEGENGLTATVLSTGVKIENGAKPTETISAFDALVYTLEANKSYKFFLGGTKWRLAAIRYVISNTQTGISGVTSDVCGERQVFSLSGQRLEAPRKGINIVNGRKVVVR